MPSLCTLSLPGLFVGVARHFEEIVTNPDLECTEDQVSIDEWEAQLGKLNAWAVTIHIGAQYQDSLEFQLRDHPEPREELMEMLRWLRTRLYELSMAVLPDGNGIVSVQRSYEDLRASISALHALLPRVLSALSQPPTVDLEPHVQRAKTFVNLDLTYIARTCPVAATDDSFILRLPNMMTTRRAILGYRSAEHATKLSQGIHSVPKDSSLPAPAWRSPYLDREHVPTLDPMLLWYHADEGEPVLPDPPVDPDSGKPFKCPYCGFEVVVHDMAEWAAHVFADISPYFCVFAGCGYATKMCVSREGWEVHLHEEHEVQLNSVSHCVLCGEYQEPSDIEGHLVRHMERMALVALMEERPSKRRRTG